jgi:hypothetical protein
MTNNLNDIFLSFTYSFTSLEYKKDSFWVEKAMILQGKNNAFRG